MPTVQWTTIQTAARPSFVLVNQANQVLSATGATKLTLDTEILDSNSEFASSKFTVTRPGYVWAVAKAHFGESVGQLAAEHYSLAIHRNGAAIEASRGHHTVATDAQAFTIRAEWTGLCAVGDYIEVFITIPAQPRTIYGDSTTLMIRQD